jgi:hypothetical protein
MPRRGWHARIERAQRRLHFAVGISGGNDMLNDREKILTALREKPLKIFEVMKRANLPNQEACQALLLKMRDEGAVKFDIHKGVWHVG